MLLEVPMFSKYSHAAALLFPRQVRAQHGLAAVTFPRELGLWLHEIHLSMDMSRPPLFCSRRLEPEKQCVLDVKQPPHHDQVAPASVPHRPLPDEDGAEKLCCSVNPAKSRS